MPPGLEVGQPQKVEDHRLEFDQLGRGPAGARPCGVKNRRGGGKAPEEGCLQGGLIQNWLGCHPEGERAGKETCYESSQNSCELDRVRLNGWG